MFSLDISFWNTDDSAGRTILKISQHVAKIVNIALDATIMVYGQLIIIKEIVVREEEYYSSSEWFGLHWFE